jgi:hypothetical protein
MTGHVAPVRLERVQPRRSVARHDPPAAIPTDHDDQTMVIDLVGGADDGLLGERWTRLRETWAQMTFFLFDGDSWRR